MKKCYCCNKEVERGQSHHVTFRSVKNNPEYCLCKTCYDFHQKYSARLMNNLKVEEVAVWRE